MNLALAAHVPAAAPAHTLQLWVGVTGAPAPPTLAWTLDGRERSPVVVRPLQPVLTGPYAGADSEPVFSGFFEFGGLAAQTPYRIELRGGGQRLMREIATLPDTVPFGPQRRLNVLLISCFYAAEDKTGIAGRLLSGLHVRPDMVFYTGDQVYLDLPTLRTFRDDAAWLGRKFVEDYRDNWFGKPAGAASAPEGFPRILALAPGAFLPDDHEYWNNYPFSTPIARITWTEAGRQRWRGAAEQAYRGFQQNPALPFGVSRMLAIEPLSILLLESRVTRDAASVDRDHDLLGRAGRAAATAWADDLVASAAAPQPRYGVLVTGQSLFRSAAGRTWGRLVDYELPDYAADYAFMLHEIERVTRAGLPVLCLTGDVHWGRVLRADDTSARAATIFEVVSSPASLVTTPFVDQARETWGAIGGLWGVDAPWPRHGDPENPPERFGSVHQYAPRTLSRAGGAAPAAMRGNHAKMLRFARVGAGVHVEVQCIPLHAHEDWNAANGWSAALQLQPIR